MQFYEVNCDGFVGPTHNYSGLAVGNLASLRNALRCSNPRLAALQSLKKMKFLHDLGLKQVILPPHERPHFACLCNLGFSGSREQIIQQAYKTSPKILYSCCSSSAMWAANSATVSPSADNENRKIYFTPANLAAQFYRQIESDFTSKMLQRIFANKKHFCHNAPLPSSSFFGDEGAANHSRMCSDYGDSGLHIFVYGKEIHQLNALLRLPARQSLEASQAVARLNNVAQNKAIFWQQNPYAINHGVFHNDVVCVANKNVLLCHQQAFINQKKFYTKLKQETDFEIKIIEIKNAQLPLEEAVNSYLFNSQLISVNKEEMALILPLEVQEYPAAFAVVKEIVNDSQNPIRYAHYVNCRQSMRNGGGPACLRLRVVMNAEEFANMEQNYIFDEDKYDKLSALVTAKYRDNLSVHDLHDSHFIDECLAILDEFTKILDIGSIYSFQQI